MTQTLGFLQGSFWLYPLNYLAFAQTAWDLDADPQALLPGYCQARFGDEAVAELFVRWEDILRGRLDMSELSYAASPFADWAVPPMPDAASAEGAVARSEGCVARLQGLLAEFRALGSAVQEEVLALELSLLQLRAFEETMGAKLADMAGSEVAAKAHSAASREALEQAARYVLEQVPLELRGGWMDWWAKETLGLPRP